jgi:hypothetical protein
MDINWPDLYLRHFVHYLGKPFDVQVYRQEDGDSLRIATFDRRYAPNYKVYSSLGLSHHAADLGGIGEVILLSDDKGKDVPLIFVHSLFFILKNKVPLHSRFAIGGIEMVNADFAEYFQKAAIYYSLANGFDDGFEKVRPGRGPAGVAVEGLVYQGIFISWAEQDFLNRNGPVAFEEKFHAQDSDPCSLRRPSCV